MVDKVRKQDTEIRNNQKNMKGPLNLQRKPISSPSACTVLLPYRRATSRVWSSRRTCPLCRCMARQSTHFCTEGARQQKQDLATSQSMQIISAEIVTRTSVVRAWSCMTNGEGSGQKKLTEGACLKIAWIHMLAQQQGQSLEQGCVINGPAHGHLGWNYNG